MTDERLKQLRVMCDAASPGPWEAHAYAYGRNDDGLAVSDAAGSSILEMAARIEPWRHERVSNAQFICASRDAIPALLDEVDALTAERDALKAEVERMRHTCEAAQEVYNAYAVTSDDGYEGCGGISDGGRALIALVDIVAAYQPKKEPTE